MARRYDPVAHPDARGARRQARKLEKVAQHSHSGFAGKSIIEQIESQLTAACTRYLELRSGGVDERQTARGQIRGLAIALSFMGVNCYHGGRGNVVKAIEREYFARVKDPDRPIVEVVRLLL